MNGLRTEVHVPAMDSKVCLQSDYENRKEMAAYLCSIKMQ